MFYLFDFFPHLHTSYVTSLLALLWPFALKYQSHHFYFYQSRVRKSANISIVLGYVGFINEFYKIVLTQAHK